MLVLSWHFKAATMCEFSKEEFVSGMQRLGCDSLERLKVKLPELRRELRDENKFRQIYDYAYACAASRTSQCRLSHLLCFILNAALHPHPCAACQSSIVPASMEHLTTACADSRDIVICAWALLTT